MPASQGAQWQRIWLQCRKWGFDPLGREVPLEKEMSTHSSILAWRIPWTEEPGRLQSMESQSWTQLTHWTTANLMGCHCWDCITVQNEKHVDIEKAWARMWSFFPDSDLGFPGWLDSRFSLWLPPAPSGKASVPAILLYPSANSKHVRIWPPLSVCPGEHPVLPVFSNSTH